jgi:hypothetical protein
MNRFPRFAIAMSITVATFLCVAVYHQRLIPIIPTVSAAVAGAQDQGSQDQGPDPAAVNQVPAGPSYTTEAPPPGQQAAPGQPPDDSNYAEQPTETASEPPPPLPDYSQPPTPADGYIWTPGYWAWGPNGYYWVPGAWVEPPYVDALWTPGYWGFYGGRYLFYPGHWGQYIGFYGGINYGFGYIGIGYEGGYWNAGHFLYNRVYNNLNTRVVHNVYSYNAGNRAISNRAGNNLRTSYRGGAGGVQARPRPSEAAAWREPTAPRMSSQVQHARSFQSNRGQLANTNHGRPTTPAVSRPIPADRNVKPAVHGSGGGGKNEQHR